MRKDRHSAIDPWSPARRWIHQRWVRNFRGQKVNGLSSREWRRLRGAKVAYIAQEPIVSLDPTLTVGRQLSEVIRLHDDQVSKRAAANSRASDLLARCGISRPREVAELYPHQISGGMAQRVAIARALAGNPALLIADEPTTALDVTIQAEILDLLNVLLEESGMSILFVTHDWGVVADICSKAVVMYAGQVVEVGPVGDVLRSPRHPYTRALLRANPHLVSPDERLKAIEGSVPRPGQWPGGCRFASRCDIATARCSDGPIVIRRVSGSRVSRCLRFEELAKMQGDEGGGVHAGTLA